MIREQLISRGIADKKVIDAFEKIPRENFMHKDYEKYAYCDSASPIGYRQTISQPYVVALMTELLSPQKTEHICEIGTGSGYQAAILSELAEKVTTFEIIPKLHEFGRENLKKLKIKNVTCICTDGSSEDVLKECPYDKIIVTAATEEILKCWVKALKENGLIVLPQKTEYNYEELKVYKKKKDKLELFKTSIPVVFVPLTKK